MSSTNKTTNYDLSQYIGTDKPTYLGDYNGDMLKIDTQMKTNATSASNANTLAQTAKDTADGAETHAQTAITNAGTADTKATNAQNTATSALTKATANETAIAGILATLNLNSFDIITNSDMTCNNGTLASSQITVAKNSDGSLCKVYGTIFTTGSADGAVKVTFNTSLRPASEFTVTNLGIQGYALTGETIGCSATFKTNGNIEINGFASAGTGMKRIVVLPMLIFVKDFGDTPSQNA